MNAFGKFLIFAFVFLIGVVVGISVATLDPRGSPEVPAVGTVPSQTPGTPSATAAPVPPGVPRETVSPVSGAPSAAGTPVPTADPGVTPAPADGASPGSGVTAQDTGSSAAALDDPILGTWKGDKSVMFVISGSGTITFRPDFTASASGRVTAPGIGEKLFSADDLVWENLGNGKYRGSYGGRTLDFTLSGGKLTVTINPKKAGLHDALDMDIPVELTRVT
jgi:hypothetical protein